MARARKILGWTLAAVLGLPLLVFGSIAAWMWSHDKVNGQIVSSGEKRQYLLHVPQSYDSSKAVPLVISLHPAASWPAAEMNISGWNRLSDRYGFIVVYPSGRGFPHFWPVGPHSVETEVRFISDLIDKLESAYKIDTARVYVDGMSNGGGMAFAVSCRMPGRIAAVGAVAAAEALPFSWCGAADPVPMIAFHGSGDRIAPYQGGMSGDPVNPRKFPAIRDWVADWARRNRCPAAPVETQVSKSVRRLGYANCPNDADVVLYTIENGGHSWPGGDDLPEWLVGRTTHEIDATAMLWEFYAQHPKNNAKQ